MTTNPLTKLIELAVQVFPHASGKLPHHDSMHMDDAIFNALQQVSFSYSRFRKLCASAVPTVFPEPAFAPLLVEEDGRTPMLLTVTGGRRVTPESVLSDVFASAWLQIMLLGFRNDETTYVKLVVENYEELMKGMRGEKVKEFNVTGISGISLSKGLQVSTPWGTLRSVPDVENTTLRQLISQRPTTTCTLVDERYVSVQMDASEDPEGNFDSTVERRDHNANLLFALSCVLALEDDAVAGGPIETWSTSFLPFSCSRGGSFPISPPSIPELVNIDEKVGVFETWAKIVASNHSEEMDFAVSRLMSAIVHRADARDSLVDAVMVWENLLGARSEVLFRVTTALTKLLVPEAGREEQQAFRKRLRTVYNTRSDIVHGVTVEYSTAKEDRDVAVNVALKALRELYRRGEEWLAMSSNDRVDALLLGK